MTEYYTHFQVEDFNDVLKIQDELIGQRKN